MNNAIPHPDDVGTIKTLWGPDGEQEIVGMQERFIIRLRAALRALGKTTEEINAIVMDEDYRR